MYCLFISLQIIIHKNNQKLTCKPYFTLKTVYYRDLLYMYKKIKCKFIIL